MKKLLTLISTTLLLTTTIFGLQTKAQDNIDTDPKYDAKIDIVDPNNVPSYVKDYLKCPTKYLKNHFDLFLIKEDGSIEYQCPPTLKEKGCSVNVFFNVTPKGQKMNNIVEENGQPVILNDKNHPRIDDGRRVPFGWNCDIWNAYYGSEGGGCGIETVVNKKYVQEHISPISTMSDAKSNELFGEYKGYKCLQIPLSLLSQSDLTILKQSEIIAEKDKTDREKESRLVEEKAKNQSSVSSILSSSSPQPKSSITISNQTISSQSQPSSTSSSQNISTSSQSPQTYSPSSTPTAKAEQTNDQNQPNYTTPIITAITIVLLGLATYFIVKSRKNK